MGRRGFPGRGRHALRLACAGESGRLCPSCGVKEAALLAQPTVATEEKGRPRPGGRKRRPALHGKSPQEQVQSVVTAQSSRFRCAEEGPGLRLEGVVEKGTLTMGAKRHGQGPGLGRNSEV